MSYKKQSCQNVIFKPHGSSVNFWHKCSYKKSSSCIFSVFFVPKYFKIRPIPPRIALETQTQSTIELPLRNFRLEACLCLFVVCLFSQLLWVWKCSYCISSVHQYIKFHPGRILCCCCERENPTFVSKPVHPFKDNA